LRAKKRQRHAQNAPQLYRIGCAVGSRPNE
jgi:hypothetical protein